MHENAWFLMLKAQYVGSKICKKNENVWFATCGQNLTKKTQKITHFSSFFALFHRKRLFLRPSNRSKAIIPQSPFRVFLLKIAPKSDSFSLFFRNLFGLSVQYFASDFPKGSISEMKSQKIICPMRIEKTCFFIKNTKFHICIL